MLILQFQRVSEAMRDFGAFLGIPMLLYFM
jgi:hypothetical protein